MDEFEFQLRAEKEYEQGGSSTAGGGAPVVVDPRDGLEMVWDEKQQGYVPKVGRNSRQCAPLHACFLLCSPHWQANTLFHHYGM